MMKPWLSVVILCFWLTGCGGVAERNNTGNAAYRDGEYERALVAYQSAQVMAPDDPLAYFNAAGALIQLDALDDAINALEQALTTADDGLKADAYYNLGNVFFEIREYDAAIQAYQQTLLLRPDDTDARYNMELALLTAVQPTPTAQEQQTDPQLGQTDPETTPTDQPRSFDGPTPTPPPLDLDPSATPDRGEGQDGETGPTPAPQSEGEMTIEQARQLLDQIQQEQVALSEFLERSGAPGDPSEKDW